MNWFRRGEDKRFLWPGFGENSRVLKWMVERLEGTRGRHRDRDRLRPRRPSSSTWTGWTRDRADVEAALDVDLEEWKAEIPLIEEWFEKIGDSLPTSMRDELEALKLRLGV